MNDQMTLANVDGRPTGLSVPSGSGASPLPNLPVLSIRQPWAWLILNAGKDIENRCWKTHFRGWLLIHAAKGMTRDEYEDAFDFASHCGFDIHRAPSFRDFDGMRGGIVGMAKLGNCVRGSDSPWFVGEWGFVLDEVKPLPFAPCNGALGFFRLQNNAYERRGEQPQTQER